MSSYLLITSGEKKVTHFYMFKRKKKKKKTLESERCLWRLLTSLLILNTFCLLMKYSFPIVIVKTMEFPINVKVSLTFITGDHSAIVIERFIKLD